MMSYKVFMEFIQEFQVCIYKITKYLCNMSVYVINKSYSNRRHFCSCALQEIFPYLRKKVEEEWSNDPYKIRYATFYVTFHSKLKHRVFKQGEKKHFTEKLSYKSARLIILEIIII